MTGYVTTDACSWPIEIVLHNRQKLSHRIHCNFLRMNYRWVTILFNFTAIKGVIEKYLTSWEESDPCQIGLTGLWENHRLDRETAQ